jgi:hypothetical protein
MSSVWGKIARGRGSVFRYIPSRGKNPTHCSDWEEVRLDDLRDAALRTIGRGEGIPEVTLDLDDDLRILAPSLSVLNDHLPDTVDAQTCHVRTAFSAGREFYALFLRNGAIRYLGALEMVEGPPAVWMIGEDVPSAGEGEVFCAPPMTLPFGTKRSLIVRTITDLRGRGKGVFAYRWLIEESLGLSRIDRAATGPSPYSAALSALLGIDLFSLHKGPEREGVPPGIVPAERIRGFFMGTLPGRDHDGRMVGARSVELAIAMFLGVDGPPPVERIKVISKKVSGDKALFSLLDRMEMDPFFLQKLFKLNKAHSRLGEHPMDTAFPDTAAVNVISSSRRRGVTSSGICELTGLAREALRDLEERFGIEPSVQRGNDLDGGSATPMVLSWPEASVVLVEGLERERERLKGRILITTDLSDAFTKDADGILYADIEEDVIASLKRAFPDASFTLPTGKD